MNGFQSPKTFGKRLEYLMEKDGIDTSKKGSSKELSDKMYAAGIIEYTDQSGDDESKSKQRDSTRKRIDEHRKWDEATLNYEWVRRYCDYFKCSADYLFGYVDLPTHENTDIQKAIGLTERSIDILKNIQDAATRQPEDAFDDWPVLARLELNVLNEILKPASNIPKSSILESLTYYLYGNFEYYYDDYSFNDESLYEYISEIGFFDKRLGIAFSGNDDFVSQAFWARVQNDFFRLREKLRKNLPPRIVPEAHSKYDTDDEDINDMDDLDISDPE